MDELDKITGEDIEKRYKVNVLREIQNGRVGLSSDIEYLKRAEKKKKNVASDIDKDTIGIPDRYRVKRRYTVSAKAVEVHGSEGVT